MEAGLLRSPKNSNQILKETESYPKNPKDGIAFASRKVVPTLVGQGLLCKSEQDIFSQLRQIEPHKTTAAAAANDNEIDTSTIHKLRG